MMKKLKEKFKDWFILTPIPVKKSKSKTVSGEYKKGYEMGKSLQNMMETKAFKEGLKHGYEGKLNKEQIEKEKEELDKIRQQYFKEREKLKTRLEIER